MKVQELGLSVSTDRGGERHWGTAGGVHAGETWNLLEVFMQVAGETNLKLFYADEIPKIQISKSILKNIEKTSQEYWGSVVGLRAGQAWKIFSFCQTFWNRNLGVWQTSNWGNILNLDDFAFFCSMKV